VKKKEKEEKEKGKVAHLFTVETLSTIHFAEQWRRGSIKRRRRRRRRRKGRSRLCSALLLSFSGRAFIYKRIGSSLTSPRPEREAVEQRIQQAKRTEERKQHWLTSLFLTIICQAAA